MLNDGMVFTYRLPAQNNSGKPVKFNSKTYHTEVILIFNHKKE